MIIVAKSFLIKQDNIDRMNRSVTAQERSYQEEYRKNKQDFLHALQIRDFATVKRLYGILAYIDTDALSEFIRNITDKEFINILSSNNDPFVWSYFMIETTESNLTNRKALFLMESLENGRYPTTPWSGMRFPEDLIIYTLSETKNGEILSCLYDFLGKNAKYMYHRKLSTNPNLPCDKQMELFTKTRESHDYQSIQNLAMTSPCSEIQKKIAHENLIYNPYEFLSKNKKLIPELQNEVAQKTVNVQEFLETPNLKESSLHILLDRDSWCHVCHYPYLPVSVQSRLFEYYTKMEGGYREGSWASKRYIGKVMLNNPSVDPEIKKSILEEYYRGKGSFFHTEDTDKLEQLRLYTSKSSKELEEIDRLLQTTENNSART